MERAIFNCRRALPSAAGSELSEAPRAYCYLQPGPHCSPPTPLGGQVTHKPLPGLPFEKGMWKKKLLEAV